MSFAGTPGQMLHLSHRLTQIHVDYSAPEVIKVKHFSTRSDVFSFGIISKENNTNSVD